MLASCEQNNRSNVMKAYDNGALFTVSYNQNDCTEFSRLWPCSTVKGRGAFVFNKSNGDLCDAEGTALKGNGSDWLAFSHDCQKYGEVRLSGATPNKAMQAVWGLRQNKQA
jgi:hypothetical protein